MFSAKGDRWVVVGLGNPGAEYERTRHNIGAMVAASLAASNSAKFANRLRANVAEFKLSGAALVVSTLRCYMNESGGPTKSLIDFYKLNSENLIVIHDELDLPFGALRIKLGGGDNGHNGLKSITKVLSPNYYRVRMGIGRPVGNQDPADFVLKPFNSQERGDLPDFLSRGCSAIETLIERGLEAAQSSFNN